MNFKLTKLILVTILIHSTVKCAEVPAIKLTGSFKTGLDFISLELGSSKESAEETPRKRRFSYFQTSLGLRWTSNDQRIPFIPDLNTRLTFIGLDNSEKSEKGTQNVGQTDPNQYRGMTCSNSEIDLCQTGESNF